MRGANGSGKTTLLRVCAGLVPVARGAARVLGHDLTVSPRAVRREVGMLGHAAMLYDDLTVEENVRFAVRAAAQPTDLVAPALEQLGLAGRLRTVRVGVLSAGQRRRTALASIVARRPALWLLDEPHAGLDAEGRDLLDGLLRDAAAAGSTVVFVSHELDRADAVATRMVTIAGGYAMADAVAESDDVVMEPVRVP